MGYPTATRLAPAHVVLERRGNDATLLMLPPDLGVGLRSTQSERFLVSHTLTVRARQKKHSEIEGDWYANVPGAVPKTGLTVLASRGN